MSAEAYDVAGLEPLEGFPFPVLVSSGGADRGRSVAERAVRAVSLFDRWVGMPKMPPVFVVGPDDWDKVATIPVYGMPHVENDRVVVGQQPAAFWSTLTDVIFPLAGDDGRRVLRRVYGDPSDLGGFADLLVSHELAHLAHGDSWPAGPVTFWVQELVANLGLQGYVSEVEPEETARLETIFEVTWGAPGDNWPVRDLLRMEDSLEGDGSNYVWFEFGLLVLARRLWRTAGVEAFQRLVAAMRGRALDFEQVVELLAELDPGVARAVRKWPHFSPGG